jgi:hypothetical protein
VASSVVETLEAIDVDECHHEPAVCSTRPIDLQVQGHSTHLAAVRTRQLVEVGRTQGSLEATLLASGVGPVPGRALPVFRGALPILSRLEAEAEQLLRHGPGRLSQHMSQGADARVSLSAGVVARDRQLVSTGSDGISVAASVNKGGQARRPGADGIYCSRAACALAISRATASVSVAEPNGLARKAAGVDSRSSEGMDSSA